MILWILVASPVIIIHVCNPLIIYATLNKKTNPMIEAAHGDKKFIQTLDISSIFS